MMANHYHSQTINNEDKRNTITFKYKHQHTAEIWNVVIDKDTLIKDWQNDAKYCPPNDTKLMSVTIDDKELLGTCLPKKTDFERFIKYLINKKKITSTELKNAFKNDGWKFKMKEPKDSEETTDIFVFEKSMGKTYACVWLSFNSFKDVKTYSYEIELDSGEDYDSFSTDDDFESLQDVLRDINEEIAKF